MFDDEKEEKQIEEQAEDIDNKTLNDEDDKTPTSDDLPSDSDDKENFDTNIPQGITHNKDEDIDNSDEPVSVQSVQFPSFDTASQVGGEENKNLDLLMDVKLQLSVELGKTELPIKKVLELTRGSIVELDKIAGEPVALYANEKLVAFGEVVVIEDNFGLRITSIYEPEDRLKGLQ